MVLAPRRSRRLTELRDQRRDLGHVDPQRLGRQRIQDDDETVLAGMRRGRQGRAATGRNEEAEDAQAEAERVTWEEEDQVPCGEVDFVADYEAALEAEEEDDDEEGEEGEGEDAMEA